MMASTATKKTDVVLTWLNDAYTMEQALVEVLDEHAQQAAEEPEVHDRIAEHLEETRQHVEIVKNCIHELGGQAGRGKQAYATMFGAGKGMINQDAHDTLVKNAVSDYAAEQFEIATYRMLIDAATELGEDKVASDLKGILKQEESMADFLAKQLPEAVKETLTSA
jgi:ferritin-like metal-binding protein YciE